MKNVFSGSKGVDYEDFLIVKLLSK